MFLGAVMLLIAAFLLEGIPVLTARTLLILVYLSAVSGALGFYLWTRSQAFLTAFESSSVNNLVLIEIALLDFIVFRRSFSALQVIAVLIVFGAVILIQTKPKARQ